MDTTVLSLSAKGPTTGEVSARFAEVYGGLCTIAQTLSDIARLCPYDRPNHGQHN